MNKIINYEGKCKSCGWVYGTSGASVIAGMPAVCAKCGADMATCPVFERDGRGRTFDLSIFCKETGATFSEGALITEEEILKAPREKLERILVEKLSQAFANIVTNAKKRTMLIQEGL